MIIVAIAGLILGFFIGVVVCTLSLLHAMELIHIKR